MSAGGVQRNDRGCFVFVYVFTCPVGLPAFESPIFAYATCMQLVQSTLVLVRKCQRTDKRLEHKCMECNECVLYDT